MKTAWLSISFSILTGFNITLQAQLSPNGDGSKKDAAASYRYDPYGNTISNSGSLASANVYRFSSKEVHTGSGLYYYGHRFYEANLQRWVNRDPLLEEGFEVVRDVLPVRSRRLLGVGELLEGPSLTHLSGKIL